MEKKNLYYSLKNIPVPSKDVYLKCLIDKVKSLIVRMRWKVFFFDRRIDKHDVTENYGFKSENAPPQSELLTPFENDLYELVRSLEFRSYETDFQRQLRTDVKEINSSPQIFVKADKTTNLYKVPKDKYAKLMTDHISAKYKKSSPSSTSKINKEAKKIAVKHDLETKINVLAESNAFVTIKDHKDNFPNTIKCRLINPAKSEIGIMSRTHLQAINNCIRGKTNLNQWQNTSTALAWFKDIPDKKKCKFFQLDIVDFYPSISEELLLNALNFAKRFQIIEEDVIEIILHCRKSLLFNGKDVWEKKSNPNFDVTMGSFDGAEICELVGLFLLNQMRDKFRNLNFGLYRDDGLGYTTSMSGSQQEKIKKEISQLYKTNGLEITILTNLTQVNFLDITFSLIEEKYWPYRKPNNEPLYINRYSNHPPCIIRELPKMIEKRLSDLSCNQDEFEKAKPEYEDALKKSGFNTCLTFSKSPPKKKHRSRKIIWFNPPYNLQVQTNIGRKFMNLISKHFPTHHKLRKIFNKNTIKLSYSCTKNMASLISSHNKKILNRQHNEEGNQRMCNCRSTNPCPLNGECLQSAVVYKADVTATNTLKSYIGCTALSFKQRFTDHKSSFRNKNQRNKTTLAKYVWDLKEKGITPVIKWSILKKGFPYSCGSRRCDLCLEEKLQILQADNPDSLLNKRSEIVSKCPHARKYKLKKHE